MGDTPNDLTEDQFHHLGEVAEGYSGSDIAVVVREALMEPLRKCQVAKQYIRCGPGGMYHPCEDYPNCAYCPMDLSDTVFLTPQDKICRFCGAERITLYEIATELLQVFRNQYYLAV